MCPSWVLDTGFNVAATFQPTACVSKVLTCVVDNDKAWFFPNLDTNNVLTNAVGILQMKPNACVDMLVHHRFVGCSIQLPDGSIQDFAVKGTIDSRCFPDVSQIHNSQDGYYTCVYCAKENDEAPGGYEPPFLIGVGSHTITGSKIQIDKTGFDGREMDSWIQNVPPVMSATLVPQDNGEHHWVRQPLEVFPKQLQSAAATT